MESSITSGALPILLAALVSFGKSRSAGLSILQLRAKARRMHSQHGVRLFVIDYLQLLNSTSRRSADNRQQEIADISSGIKALAKELKVPVIVLAQLNREIEKDKNRKPRLSDLRESGSIEQDADLVCFIYRPEYYKIYEDHYGSTLGVGEIIVAKHRNGALDNVLLRFIPELAKFTDLETAEQAVLYRPIGPVGRTFMAIEREAFSMAE